MSQSPEMYPSPLCLMTAVAAPVSSDRKDRIDHVDD